MSDTLERLLVGRTLVGRYRVERVIGRGGMSVVYEALDERLERPVALKIIRFPHDPGEQVRRGLRERLRREAAAAARISSHPNVVQIYDYGTDAELDLDFIAMELLRGRDLKEALARGPLPLGEAHPILLEAARGVAAGHRAGIVHRDVKPANIFLVGERDVEQVRILDFGIAKPLEPTLEEEDDLTRDGRLPHSPAYASPEQLDPERRLSSASDVYQLGLIAYEVLTGRRPYTDEDRVRIHSGIAAPLPGDREWKRLPGPIRAVVERALEIDPTRRFVDADAFAAALDRAFVDDDSTFLAEPVAAPFFGSGGDDDHTMLAPPTPTAGAGMYRPDRDDGTAFGPGAPAPIAAAPTPPPGSDSPSTPDAAARRARRRRGGRSPAIFAAMLAGVAILIWAASRQVRDAVETLPIPEPDASSIPAAEELEEVFRELIVDAFERLTEEVSALEGEEAARAVQTVVAEIQRSWVEGDLEDHLALYAERVDFRGDSRATREDIAAARAETMERYPERQISVDRLAIEFVAPGRARALVDRRWHFEGDEVFEGTARDELVLVREADEWVVVAERELERVEDPG